MYGLIQLVEEHILNYFSGTFPYALHVRRSNCQCHVLLACIEDDYMITVVLEGVVVETGWEQDVARVLSAWYSCVKSVKGPEKLVVVGVGNLSPGLFTIFQGNSIAMMRVDLQ